ncbi:sarcosine oxidase subunit gamma family protein [Salinicola sp. LHM]|uniref:sarcosine oxidase subunit gamma n=1 Tax=Salinicola sp. LHM TaxID=3065298 RepID=UPI002ACE0370|nr:sarcosine oxidase subunit gamma family protein [Salinicola sp. LHM]WQH34318.1 sarcosine oxidase subunit gamma family protein [Salinicola sp. LHM]
MSEIREFDCRPNDQTGAESPLAWSFQRGPAPAADAQAGVTLRESAFMGHLILRGGAIVLDEAVREVLGINLPARPNTLTVDAKGERSIQWLSPDEWLILVPGGEEFVLEKALRHALGQAHFSLVNVSGGQTVITLRGPKARETLKKSTPYDVHPSAFPVGKGVTTIFAKTSLILRQPQADCWELIVRRSFADYVYRWLLDAAAEFGVTVERR